MLVLIGGEEEEEEVFLKGLRSSETVVQ